MFLFFDVFYEKIVVLNYNFMFVCIYMYVCVCIHTHTTIFLLLLLGRIEICWFFLSPQILLKFCYSEKFRILYTQLFSVLQICWIPFLSSFDVSFFRKLAVIHLLKSWIGHSFCFPGTLAYFCHSIKHTVFISRPWVG